MSAYTRLTVAVDRLNHHARRLPAGIWLPFLACLAVVGLTSIGSALGLSDSLRPLSGDDARPGALLGARMVLGDKDSRIDRARAAMLRREYEQCRIAEDGLHRALIARDGHAVAQWRTRARTVRFSYGLIAAQSTDQVFAMTGLPHRL